MSLWIHWCNALWLLRPACSRTRSFMWFATAVAGLTVRTELLGVTTLAYHFWMMKMKPLRRKNGNQYPAKPVRVIVPPAPGSGVDAIVRMVAPKLSETWGQPVTVENHVGAGGTVGAGMVAKSPADGYTLLAHSSAHVVSAALRTNLPYDPLRDFVPIAPLTSQAYVLVVGKQAGIKTVGDLIAAAKSRPGELKFTSAGIGTGTHLMAEKFNVDAGVKMVHVPTAGAGAGNGSNRGTHHLLVLFDHARLAAHSRGQASCVRREQREAPERDAGEVPTVAEAGLPGYDSTLWYGVWAPAGTPNAVVEKIAKDVTLAPVLTHLRCDATPGFSGCCVHHVS